MTLRSTAEYKTGWRASSGSFCAGVLQFWHRPYIARAAEGVFVQEVDNEVRRVKQHDETRREYMTLAMEIKRRELASFAEGEKTGEKTGEKKKETMMILAMLRKGFSAENIAECAQTTVEYITELGKKHHLL